MRIGNSKGNRLAMAISATLAGFTGSGLVQAQTGPEMLQLEEILVTARKQEENIQEVPLAITAITSQAIQDLGLRDLSDISKVTAGLIFDNEFSRVGNRPVIRGQANITGASGVAYFIDGVYITGSIAAYDLNDVERIEVVKGPQSALYGRNTYAGAINMITKSPGDEFSGNLKLDAAEDDEYEASLSLRGPLIDGVLGGGITARYYENDGAFQNTFDNTPIGKQRSRSLSGVLSFTPTEALDIRLRGYYSELRDGQPPLFATSAAENNCYFDNGTLYRGAGRYYCGVIKPRPINSDWRVQAPDAQQTNDDLQTSLSVSYDINERWRLSSITGYNDSEETFIVEADYQPIAFPTAIFARIPLVAGPPPWPYRMVNSVIDFTFATFSETDDWSQELRLEFAGDRVSFVVGGYYFDQSSTDTSIRELPPDAQAIANANLAARLQSACAQIATCSVGIAAAPATIVVPRNVNELDVENQAVFALLSFGLTDTLRLTAEGRYQEEEITRSAIAQNLGGAATVFPSETAKFDGFTPRVTLDWQFTDRNMLYALFAQGTKPGGFNSVDASQGGVPTFDEEEVDSFEIGAKNVFADGQLVANLALFYNEISGYQLSQNVSLPEQGRTTSATVNAGDAEVQGAELQLSYRPRAMPSLAFTLNYAYTDPTFSRGFDEQQGVLNDVLDDGLVNCSTGDQFPDVAGCQSAFGSIKDKQIPRTAEHQAYLDIELRRPLPVDGGWDFVAGANYSYESSKYAQVHNLAETGDTSLVNARIGLVSSKYSIVLYGRNLTGEDSVPNILRYADGALDLRRSFVGSQRRDTNFGLTATVNF